MPRFFVDSGSVHDGRVRMSGDQARHLARSLRARPGELVVVVEDGRIEHGVVIDESGRDTLSGSIAWSRDATGEPRLETHVLQAIPQHGMDEAVAGLADMGATHIRPVVSLRTEARSIGSRSEQRVARWRAIARESAQLAGRAAAPLIVAPAMLADARASLPRDAVVLVLDVRGARALRDIVVDVERTHAIAIGPEGGFDPTELEMLHATGGISVHLGPRVLPTRIAGTVALALLLAAAGELDTPAVPAPKIGG